MSFLLDSTSIREPNQLIESNNTQFAQHRALNGTISRDYFGDNKKVWTLIYTNAKKADYDTINTIYASYIDTGTAIKWSSDETNYTITEVNVHVDLDQRGFVVGGSDYISNFGLVLTEA